MGPKLKGLCVAMVVALGCSTQPPPPPANFGEVRVGRAGGHFELEGAILDVPENALLEEVSLRVTRIPVPFGAPVGAEPIAWLFEPEGLRFRQVVALSLPISGPEERQYVIATAPAASEEFSPLLTTRENRFVRTETLHFSVFVPVSLPEPDAGASGVADGGQDAGSGDSGTIVDGGVLCGPEPVLTPRPIGPSVDAGLCWPSCSPSERCMDTEYGALCGCRYSTPGDRGCAGICSVEKTSGLMCSGGSSTTLDTFFAGRRAIELSVASAPDGGAMVIWGEGGWDFWGTELRVRQLSGGSWATVQSPVGPISSYNSSRSAMVRYAPDGTAFIVFSDGSTSVIGGGLARRDDQSWTYYPTISGMEGATHVQWQAIAFDDTGAPVVAASETANQSYGGLDEWVFLHQWRDGGWAVHPQRVGSGIPNPGRVRPNLVRVSEGMLVAFDQASALVTAIPDGGGWTSSSGGALDGGRHSFVRLAANSVGDAVMTELRDGDLFAYRWSAGQWVSLGALPCNSGRAGAVGATTTIDVAGAPSVAWWLTDGGARAQRFENGGWEELQLFPPGPTPSVSELALAAEATDTLLVGWLSADAGVVGIQRVTP